MEGLITVELDEVLDPRTSGPNSRNPGTVYHFLSVRREGQGTAEIYVSADIYNKVKALRPARGAMLGLVYVLNKFKGSFEPRLSDVVLG